MDIQNSSKQRTASYGRTKPKSDLKQATSWLCLMFRISPLQQQLGNAPTNTGELGETPGNGIQLDARKHDRYLPTYGPDPVIGPHRNSGHLLRRNRGTTSAFGSSNDEGTGRLQAGEPEWMDIDEISSKTAGVHLA